MEGALFWLSLNFFTILVLAFFSMEEMALVSFNKVRLQFYVSEGNKKAEWIHSLLKNPSQLFGTTLIGVNVATFIGSECARNFHSSIGLSPDLAPLSQVMLVIVFGELAPMFAARRYSEHVAFLGIPLLYFCSKLLTPFIWIFGWISKIANTLLGGQEAHPNLFLTQDELQKIIEDQDSEKVYSETSDFNAVSSSIFSLRKILAKDAMRPLTEESCFSSQTTVGALRDKIRTRQTFVIVYHRNIQKIIGIVYIKDLLRKSDNQKLHEFCKSPWFILDSTPLTDTLKQFRQNSETVAIVLDPQGHAIGELTFEDILEEIFPLPKSKSTVQQTLIDKTVSGDMTLKEFTQEFNAKPNGDPEETISHFLIRSLEHHPEEGDVFVLPPYNLTIKESSLLDVKSVQVTTKE